MLLFRGRSLDTLNTFELLSSYANLSLDVEKMAYASYVAELVDLMTGERQRNELLYALVVSTFEALDVGLRIRESCSGHLKSSSCQYPGFAPSFRGVFRVVRLRMRLRGSVRRLAGCCVIDAEVLMPALPDSLVQLENWQSASCYGIIIR